MALPLYAQESRINLGCITQLILRMSSELGNSYVFPRDHVDNIRYVNHSSKAYVPF